MAYLRKELENQSALGAMIQFLIFTALFKITTGMSSMRFAVLLLMCTNCYKFFFEMALLLTMHSKLSQLRDGCQYYMISRISIVDSIVETLLGLHLSDISLDISNSSVS